MASVPGLCMCMGGSCGGVGILVVVLVLVFDGRGGVIVACC